MKITTNSLQLVVLLKYLKMPKKRGSKIDFKAFLKIRHITCCLKNELITEKIRTSEIWIRLLQINIEIHKIK